MAARLSPSGTIARTAPALTWPCEEPAVVGHCAPLKGIDKKRWLSILGAPRQRDIGEAMPFRKLVRAIRRNSGPSTPPPVEIASWSSRSCFSYTEVDLPPVSDPLIIEIRARFEKRYLAQFGRFTGKGLYSEGDWRRVNWVATNLPSGGIILDVGVGPGALLNYLHGSARFERAIGIDIRVYSKFQALYRGLDHRLMNVVEMGFENASIDTVICMEVLEHLAADDFERALNELRRVSRGDLLITVPFCEPEPLSPYHQQRFDPEGLCNHFPHAEFTLLQRQYRRAVPWVLIHERPRESGARNLRDL
jgi:SAM-dependent methyltransferase